VNIKLLLEIPPWEWPESAGEDIWKVLNDAQTAPSARLTAAELAGDLVVMNDDLAESLIEIVGDSGDPEDLRAQAAISLGPALEQADLDLPDEPEEAPISEEMFDKLRNSLQAIIKDERQPKEVRRRALEASVRAADDWHAETVASAYSSGDREWVLTAVFAMHYIGGFDDQILESLDNADEEIHFEAVRAAGARAVDAAWPHIVALITGAGTPKDLLLVAIEAAANIRPGEAGLLLVDLAESEDEEIAEAASEAMAMAEAEVNAELDEEDEE
jgi:hypothetical protein